MAAIKKFIKRYFLSGLAVLIPVFGTYLILRFIIQSADRLIQSILPLRFHPIELLGINIPGFGLIITITLILFVGLIARLYIGKKLVHLGDRIISKIPFGRSIYSSIKQFTSSILSNTDKRFQSVVLVEYPRKDCWVIGFLTSDTQAGIAKHFASDMVNIFVPTTPNPTSGFLIIVPKSTTIPLNMGIDQAFKLLITGGIIEEKNASHI